MTAYDPPSYQNQAAAAIPVWVAPPPAAAATNIPTQTETLVKTGAGVFLGLMVNTGGAGSTAAVYDGLTSAGTLLGTYDTATTGTVFNLPAGGIPFATGLTVVTDNGTPADVTVSYI